MLILRCLLYPLNLHLRYTHANTTNFLCEEEEKFIYNQNKVHTIFLLLLLHHLSTYSSKESFHYLSTSYFSFSFHHHHQRKNEETFQVNAF